MKLNLQDVFGQIDIYVFDQLLRGNLLPGMRILDAGCGYGRNLRYMLGAGFNLWGVDGNPEAIAEVGAMATHLNPKLPPERFQVALLDALPFADAHFDAVVCNSVLHFAQGSAHFHAMLHELWRVLRPGGLLFCRLGSSIGAGPDMRFEPEGDGLYLTGDGALWFLVDEPMLLSLTAMLGAELVDPLKTTLLQARRCMTTWVLRKGPHQT